jgi:transcription elongation factor Elf1
MQTYHESLSIYREEQKMRTFQCFKCGHLSEVTKKNARDIYKYCCCNCHEMRVVSNKKYSNVLCHEFTGTWDK